MRYQVMANTFDGDAMMEEFSTYKKAMSCADDFCLLDNIDIVMICDSINDSVEIIKQ